MKEKIFQLNVQIAYLPFMLLGSNINGFQIPDEYAKN